MATEDDATIRRVERERRKREDELLLLLLLLLGEAARDAKAAAAHGNDTGLTIRSVIAGNGFTGHTGAAPIIARASAQAHRDGFRRAGLMVGTRDVARADAGPLADLATAYRPTAQAAADAMAQTLSDAVSAKVIEAKLNGAGAAGVRRAVAEAFELRGYTRSSTFGVELGVERAIVGAHNAGILDAARGGHDALAGVTGIEHVSILDAVTSDICWSRAGLKLPADDPYWENGGVPPLHYGCRSVLRILSGDYTISDWRPTIPPAPGFGYSPLGVLGARLVTS